MSSLDQAADFTGNCVNWTQRATTEGLARHFPVFTCQTLTCVGCQPNTQVNIGRSGRWGSAMERTVIERHKTAIRRGDFSRPVKCLFATAWSEKA